MITAHKRLAVELLLSAAAGAKIDLTKLDVAIVPAAVAESMMQDGLLTIKPDQAYYRLTPRAHAIVNKIVAAAQDLL